MKTPLLLTALLAAPAVANPIDTIAVAPTNTAWCGEYLDFTTTHTSANGVGDIANVYFSVGIKGAKIYAWWKAANNRLYLQNETETQWGAGIPAGSGPIGNTRGNIEAFTVTAVDSNTLRLTWRVTVTALVADVARYTQKAMVMSKDVANTPKVWHESVCHFLVPRPDEVGGVLFAGDSITARWETLKADFPFAVGNRGTRGIKASELAAEVEWSVNPYHPRAVVLLVGINDLRHNRTPQAVATSTVATIAKLRENNPALPVVVCSIMPTDYAEKSLSPTKIVETNTRVLCALEGDANIRFCDTFGVFALVPSLQPDLLEFPDGLHLNPTAYAKWRDALLLILAGL